MGLEIRRTVAKMCEKKTMFDLFGPISVIP